MICTRVKSRGAALHRIGSEGLLEIDETALIVKYDDSRIRTSLDLNVVNNGQKAGHIIGMVTAAIGSGMPFIVAGTVAGKLAGAQPFLSTLLLYGKATELSTPSP